MVERWKNIEGIVWKCQEFCCFKAERLKRVYTGFCRFSVQRSTGLKTARKRCWLGSSPQRKASVCWFNRSWGDLWTRRSRCPTGRSDRCVSPKSDTQVWVSTHTQMDDKFSQRGCSQIVHLSQLPSSDGCLLSAGRVPDPLQQPGVVRAAGRPAQRRSEPSREEHRQKAEVWDWAEETGRPRKGEESFLFSDLNDLRCFGFYL